VRVRVKKRFLKDLATLPARTREEIELFVFETLPACSSLERIGTVERMQGHKGFYKVRFGDYRVGLRVETGGSVEVMVVAHRREIYRLFP
jgi:mRNA interferase RelE/StbE